MLNVLKQTFSTLEMQMKDVYGQKPIDLSQNMKIRGLLGGMQDKEMISDN